MTTMVAAFHVIVLVFSKDLGSALIFFVVYVVMVFVATRNYFYLILGTLAGCGAGVIAAKIFSHVRVRIQAWRDPWSYIDGSGYQITQSLFAIGTGGWFGMGLYQGDPTAIPYVEADFIFSAIAEELGVFFSICLILVCVSCFIAFMNVAMRLKNEYYRLVAVGLAVTYIFQIFLTIGGGTRLIPLTGVTLPLVSYGGSSVLTTIIMFCIIQGLYCIRAEEGEHDVKKETAE
jgi:cell division protein FtsW (lipid II flippase)